MIGMEIRPGSMGKPAPGYDVHILDDSGLEVEPGSRGNIALRAHVKDLNGNMTKHPG
jgi:acyl-coenzyme A synthetase/AMP-(fatty) acid ligase